MDGSGQMDLTGLVGALSSGNFTFNGFLILLVLILGWYIRSLLPDLKVVQNNVMEVRRLIEQRETSLRENIELYRSLLDNIREDVKKDLEADKEKMSNILDAVKSLTMQCNSICRMGGGMYGPRMPDMYPRGDYMYNHDHYNRDYNHTKYQMEEGSSTGHEFVPLRYD